MIVYHATRKEYLPDILKNGLRPRQGGGLNPEEFGEAPRGVYFCKEWIDATHVLAMGNYDGIILVVDLPDSYPRYGDPRAIMEGEEDWAFYVKKPVPPSYIKEVLGL